MFIALPNVLQLLLRLSLHTMLRCSDSKAVAAYLDNNRIMERDSIIWIIERECEGMILECSSGQIIDNR